MRWWMEIEPDVPAPKRGDLMQTAVGTAKERTWMVLRSVPMLRAKNRRFAIWRARWWELEPDFRMRLYRSAIRNGGQSLWHVRPLKPAPRKRGFPDSVF